MKLNTALLALSAALGILSGVFHDRAEYKKTVEAARAANQPIPDFAWDQFINHLIPRLSAFIGSGVLASQVAPQQ